MLSWCVGYSQHNNGNKIVEEETAKKRKEKALPGTYQIIYQGKANAEAVNGDILYEVEKARDENEVKYLVINDNIKIKILPASVVKSGNYAPLKEFVITE